MKREIKFRAWDECEQADSKRVYKRVLVESGMVRTIGGEVK